MLMLYFALACLALATWTDLRTREAPDLFSIVLAAGGIVGTATGFSGVPWWSLAAGASLCFLLTTPLFCKDIFGGADVKLLTALGAVVGFPEIVGVLFWTAMAGALLGVVALVRKQQTLAYIPAIAGGVLVYTLLKAGFSRTLVQALGV